MSIESRFRSGQLLSSLSTFGIGGVCRYYLEAKTAADVLEAIHWAKNCGVPYFILGRGSNSLFDDRGFAGLVIHNKIDHCVWEESGVSVGAGYNFSLLGVQSAKRGFSGLEFAAGIPGSVGGAVYMNAGANGQDTARVLCEVEYAESCGAVAVLPASRLSFSYRFSSFQTWDGCILSARFRLEASVDARVRQMALIDYRTKTQPLKDKSAGCVFRNPAEGLSAGALIERCGLKGFASGGAKVSEVHANFIVNAQGACAEDVAHLIAEIQERVREQTGILLEPEVRRIPYEF